MPLIGVFRSQSASRTFVPSVRAGLLHGLGHDIQRIVALGRGHGDRDAVVLRLEFLQVLRHEGLLPVRLGGVLDEALRHHHALAVDGGIVDEVGHGHGPRADHRHHPAELGAAVGNLRIFRPDAEDDQGLGARRLCFLQLRRHVRVLDLELADVDRRNAALLQLVLDEFTAALSVVGVVRQDGNLLEALLVDKLRDDHVRLNRVVRAHGEQVVLLRLAFGILEVFIHDDARRHIDDGGSLAFVGITDGGLGHAGIDVAEEGRHLLAGEQFLGHLRTAFVGRLVVAFDQLNLAAEHAASWH